MDDKDCSDAVLRDRVVDALAADPSVHATHVAVVAEAGVVTLSGHVPSYADRFDIERIVRRVRGVRGIAQDIAVRRPADKQLEDDQIARRALSIIEWSTGIPERDLQVTVQHGWVTLSGVVAWHYQAVAAEMAVRKLSGVTGITNRIALAPQPRPANVESSIKAALLRNAELRARGIRVTVSGEKAILEGRVSNWHERFVAERACWSAPGIRAVDNRLSLDPPTAA